MPTGITSLTNIGNGLAANDGTGDALRTGADKINSNNAAIAAAVNNLAASQAAGRISYLTKADMDADLAHADGTMADVTNDATTDNNRSYRKSGASGSGSWAVTVDRVDTAVAVVTAALDAAVTSATASAASATTSATDADAAKVDAVAAQAAAESAKAAAVAAQSATETARDTSSGIYATTAKALSNGVKSLASLVAGSGGTNGTFALAFSGGAGSGASGTFTVAGGAVVSTSINYSGDSYTSAPTVSFAASSGLTGASATAVISANVPAGKYFSVPSAGTNDYLDLWQNMAGVATATGKTYPSSALVAGLVSSLDYDSSTFGESGTITDGTTSSGSGTYTFSTPIAVSGTKVRFAYYGRGSGTIYLQAVSRAGNDNTVVAETAVAITAGYHEVTVSLAYSAGMYFGYRGASGLIALATGTPAYSYWSASGTYVAAGSTYTDATLSNAIFKVRIVTIATISPGPDVHANAANVTAMQAYTGIDNASSQWIGGPGAATPVTGTATGSSTYCIGQAMTQDMAIKRVRAFTLAPGSITIRRFTKSGNDFTAVPGDLTVTFAGVGVQEVIIPVAFKIAAGQYYAITKAATVVTVTSDVPAVGYYGGGVDATSFTATATSSAYTIQVGVELVPYSLNARVGMIETGAAARTPDGYVVVFGLGESHMAGRGERASTMTAPGSYKYNRATTSLLALADPTGNDATAITGKGSPGPGLANAIAAGTGGDIGTILVNSGEGSTYIGNQWATAGSSWTQAVTDWNTAIAAINAANLPVVGCAVYLIIGSNDAALGTTKAAFKAAVLDLAARVASLCGADVPIILAQSTGFADGSSSAGVAGIQAAQVELVRENANIHMGWTAKRIAPDGLFIDNVHYRQPGNDAMGRGAAAAVLAFGAGVSPLGIT